MGKGKDSRTEKDSFFEERLTGGSHYKTTITTEDGKTYTRRGRTSEESQGRASEAKAKDE